MLRSQIQLRSGTRKTRKRNNKLVNRHKHTGGLFRGIISMEHYWKPIWAQLQALRDSGEFRCAMCKSQLPTEYTYKSVMPWFGLSSLRAKTNVDKLIIRKYNLPSALRDGSGVSDGIKITGAMVDVAKSSGGSIQPTIFYFHCPYCGFLHQFKSSVHLAKLPHQSHNRSNSHSYPNYRNHSASRRSSRDRHSGSRRSSSNNSRYVRKKDS